MWQPHGDDMIKAVF